MKIMVAKCFAYRCILACTTRECRTHENTRAEGPEELLVARWCAGVGGSTLPPRHGRALPSIHPPVLDVTVFWVKFVFARFSPGKVRGTSLYLYERDGERFSMGGAPKRRFRFRQPRTAGMVVSPPPRRANRPAGRRGFLLRGGHALSGSRRTPSCEKAGGTCSERAAVADGGCAPARGGIARPVHDAAAWRWAASGHERRRETRAEAHERRRRAARNAKALSVTRRRGRGGFAEGSRRACRRRSRRVASARAQHRTAGVRCACYGAESVEEEAEGVSC